MSQVDPKTPNLVSYSVANESMLSSLKSKKVCKFARLGWNGKQLHVQVHGSIPTSHVDLENGDNAYIEPFFVIVNKANSRVNIWVPSISDLQAEDWYEVI